MVLVLAGTALTAPTAQAMCNATLSVYSPTWNFGYSSHWIKFWTQKEGKKTWVKHGTDALHDGNTSGCYDIAGTSPTICTVQLLFRKKDTKLKFKAEGVLNGKKMTFYSDGYKKCQDEVHYIKVPRGAGD